MDVTFLPTEIHVQWGGPAPVKLELSLPCRTITADELHTLADVVSSIEEFRAHIIDVAELT